MTTDIDIYRSANLLIRQHGSMEAEIEAAQRADDCLEAGDMGGRQVWLRILKAVKELSGTRPISPGQTMH